MVRARFGIAASAYETVQGIGIKLAAFVNACMARTTKRDYIPEVLFGKVLVRAMVEFKPGFLATNACPTSMRFELTPE